MYVYKLQYVPTPRRTYYQQSSPSRRNGPIQPYWNLDTWCVRTTHSLRSRLLVFKMHMSYISGLLTYCIRFTCFVYLLYPVSEMTCTASSGTLNPSRGLYHTITFFTLLTSWLSIRCGLPHFPNALPHFQRSPHSLLFFE